MSVCTVTVMLGYRFADARHRSMVDVLPVVMSVWVGRFGGVASMMLFFSSILWITFPMGLLH